ncbi:hypothetical protein GCM10027416_18790 [Okibacterium endophyticum]
MDIYSFAPIAAILDVAYSLVTSLASLVTPFAGAFATVLAIVIITLAVRSMLIPVGWAQVKAETTRRRLAPKLQELQRRYKTKPELLQRKTMELYAAEKASPFAGCLPTLLQAPIVSVVYALFILATINGHPNGLLTELLFGVPLGSSLLGFLGAGQVWPGVLVYLALLVIVGVVAWVSRRHASRLAMPVADGAPGGMAGLMGILSWMPFITVVFAAIVPLAATVYLTVTTSWTLIERATMRRVVAGRAAG